MKLSSVHLAALRWTISILPIFLSVLGLQTEEEYSTNGRTSVLLAISRIAGDFVLMLRLINPRDRFADVHIFWMWLLKVRLLLISTPKYLEPPTDSRIWPYSRYLLGTGV